MSARVWMRSTCPGPRGRTITYEVLVGDVVVWQRRIDIGRRNWSERRELAREQERIAFRLAASSDPLREARRLAAP